MPIYIAMAHPHEPGPPASADDGQMPAADPESAEPDSGDASGEASVTPEQLAKVGRRLESGFYDRAEVRAQIARRLLDEMDP